MKKHSFLLILLLTAGNLMAQKAEPLYVVDGVITTDISVIPPEQIQSMYVYKNEAAANVYGEKGENGAVLIVTKQGENAQNIRSFVIEEHDVAWYENQAYVWKLKIQANPQDEHAWLNYFRATRYSELESGNVTLPRAQAIVEDMKTAIPDSYTYYLCMDILTRFIDTGDNTDYGKLAIEKLPAIVGDEEINMLLGYLWRTGAADDSTAVFHAKWQQMLEQQYTDQTYPERVLRYIYNQFLGMNKNGLYFANGDIALFPAKLLQDVVGIHKDKQVIVISFLHLDEYRNALFAKLGIAPFTPIKTYDMTNNDDYRAYYADLIEYIIHATGRDAYFFPNLGQNPDIVSILSKKLYNEGLLLHYSERKYNNIAVAKRNIETRYHLEYLTEPNFSVQEWWSGNERMQMNYVVLLSHLLKEYRADGNEEQARKLSYILRMSVVNTPADEETKKTYLEILNNAEK